MRQLDGLYSLVLRLTKSEKRYFRLFTQLQQGDRLYWHLYELILRENGNDGQVQAAFVARYSAAQFESARKHLYAVLLKSLRNFRADQDLETRLAGQIEEAQILFSKGISALAIAQLQAVQQAALKGEKLALYQWALERELTYRMQSEFRGETEESLIERHETVGMLLRQQIFQHQHTALNHLLLFRYFQQGFTRSPSDDERLNDLLLEEHRINAMPHRSSFESRKLHLHFQAAYFLMTGQYADSLTTYDEMNRLFEQNPLRQQSEGLYYTYLIDGILTGLRSTGDYTRMSAFLDRVEARIRQHPVEVYGLEDLLRSHRMSIHLDQEQFTEALSLFGQSPLVTSPYALNSPTHGQMLLLFYGACASLGLGNHSAALRWINQLLDLPQPTLSQTLYTAVRLFELIIHLDRDDPDHVAYKIRSVEWKLRSHKRLFRAERLVLNSIRLVCQQGWEHAGLSALLDELQALKGSAYDSRLSLLFDFGKWLRTKRAASERQADRR